MGDLRLTDLPQTEYVCNYAVIKNHYALYMLLYENLIEK